MESPSVEECRLCLGELTETKRSIEKSDLKEQLSQVFHFVIEPLPGHSSEVCGNCLSIVSEFHKYSEKVRSNQETLASRLRPVPIAHIKIKTESSSSDELEDFKRETSDASDGEIFAEPLVSIEVKSEPLAKRTRGSQQEDETVQPKRKKKKKIIPKLKERKNKKNIALKSREELQQQDIIIQDFYEMTCDLCGHAAQDLNSLRSHFRGTHGQGIYIKCCKKKLSRKWAMIDHITVHTNPTAFRCEVCDKTFKSKRYLREHQANVHGSDEQRPFQCDQCNRFFAKESLLQTHKRHHEKMPCPQCGQVFANSISLKAHMKGAHDNVDRTKVCDRCGKGFSGPSAPSNLRQHIDKVHMGLGDKTKHQCPICYKWLLGKRALTIHVQLHSEVGKPHICDICNQNYLHSRALTRHKRFVHGEQKYECEFCGKRFKKPLALKEHRATHTGETLYTCKVCPVSMNSNASYYAHMKKAHPVEWADSKVKAAEGNGSSANDSATV
ncbi:transcription factor grauzone-like [Ochlerotatus camptorhynchus]|uniref:transcription factor grauzone-like n=1 Tax=Ochlerotatus camptorhynchus TaxID=644619 RepID=UPI0031D53E74